MQNSKIITPALGIVALGFSLACGGGGSSVATTDTGLSKLETGVFLDSPVQGLYYETASLMGTTDAEGRFTYRSGEEVTFRVGDIQLGKASGGNTITPATLFGVEVGSQDRRMVNALRLLQSIDADGNPDNGIEIEEEFKNCAEQLELNFDLDPADFTYSENLLALLRQSPRILVDADQALSHFEKTLIREEQPGADDLNRPNEYDSAADFLAARDTDSSGDLSLEEFVTVPSDNQINIWTDCFERLDINQDSFVTMEEWMGKEHPEEEIQDESIELEKQDPDQDIYAVIDVDSSGNVNSEEWLNYHIAKYASKQEEHFDRIDSDSDDRLSLSELEAKPENDSLEHHAEVFAELDLDSDGVISLSEFILNVPSEDVDRANAAFASMDINGDDFISEDELRVNPKKDAQERRNTAFVERDVDSSGGLSLEEFLVNTPEQYIVKATEHFTELDIDQDGELSEDELSGMARGRRDR